jgi:hypothetical protein
MLICEGNGPFTRQTATSRLKSRSNLESGRMHLVLGAADQLTSQLHSASTVFDMASEGQIMLGIRATSSVDM